MFSDGNTDAGEAVIVMLGACGRTALPVERAVRKTIVKRSLMELQKSTGTPLAMWLAQIRRAVCAESITLVPERQESFHPEILDFAASKVQF